MTQEILLFAIAFTASVATPGPDTMTIFSRALAGGVAKAAPYSAGIILGKLVLLTLAITGLATLAQALGPLFNMFKIAGAAYLLWIGISLWRRPISELETRLTGKASWRDSATGFALSVSNPHAIIFYVALLPAVVNVQAIDMHKYLLLCATLIIITSIVAGVYALIAHRMRRLFQSVRARRAVNRTSGAIMISAGVAVMAR